MADGNVPIRIWARTRLHGENLTLPCLDLAVKVFNGLQDIFRNVDRASIPPKIGKNLINFAFLCMLRIKIKFKIFKDIFAIPDYPVRYLEILYYIQK